MRTRPPDSGRKLIKDPPLVMAVAWGFIVGLVAGATFIGLSSRMMFGKNNVAGAVTLALILAAGAVGACVMFKLVRRERPRTSDPWKSS